MKSKFLKKEIKDLINLILREKDQNTFHESDIFHDGISYYMSLESAQACTNRH